MPLTPDTLRTLTGDIAEGRWSVPTVTFWTQALSRAGRPLTPGLRLALEREWHTGRWTMVSHVLVSALWPTRRASTFLTMRRDFASGTWSPGVTHALEEL